jgi:hypothetical protein
MTCVAKSAYTMTADIYVASISQNSTTGSIVKTWSFNQTVPCLARGIVRAGLGDNSTTVNIEDFLKVTNSMVKLRAGITLDSTVKVANIKNSDGLVIWKEGPTSGVSGSTIFEPRGSTPISDHRGHIVEYETILIRPEVQKLNGV